MLSAWRWLAGQHRIYLQLHALPQTLKRIRAIYPGSFDPVTNGHLDLIQRGANIFDELIVAVLRNPEKDPLFSVQERIEMLRKLTSNWANVQVDSFDGLTVDYARKL